MPDTQLVSRVWAHLEARDSRPRPRAEGRPRPQLVAAQGDEPAELRLYDEIGWFGCSAQDVADVLAGHRGDLHVRVNSPGGDVFDGYAIYNILGQLDGTVTVTVEGLAASAASLIAMAGDRVRMCLASQLMIHEAHGVCMGNASDMKDFAEVLDSIGNTLAAVYAERAGGEPGEWRTAMLAETWYTPQEAVDAGLADEVMQPKRRRDGDGEDEPDMPLSAGWNLEVFQFAGRRHAPAPDVPAPRAPSDVAAKAVGPHETSVKEGEWDGPANEKRLPSPMPVATARKVYAWYDESAVEDGKLPKSACKLPHHFVGADGTPGAASVNGLRNALARLPQTEGLSDAERATIERHLRAHLPDDEDDGGESNAADTTVDGRHHAEPDAEPEPAENDPPAPDPDAAPEVDAASWEALTAALLEPPATADDLLKDLLMKGAPA